jgi:hypothetical protein
MAEFQPQKQPIVEQCTGCTNVQGENCRIWASPATKWRIGTCPSATHVKPEAKTAEQKVRVGQQKQKRKGA